MKLPKTKRPKYLTLKVWLVALFTTFLCWVGYRAQAQCYEFSANGYTAICENQTPTFTSYDGCGTEQNYAHCINFTVEYTPFQILIDGEQYYTFLPDNILCTNFWIEDSNGWVTGTSCGPILCSEDYELELDLPLGDYTLYIANVGVPAVQLNIQGCVYVTITAGFLSLGVKERRLVHTHQGLRIQYKGNLYDFNGQLVGSVKK